MEIKIMALSRSHQKAVLSCSGHRSRRITGFTLIEVLVVVAIIALLISILLPSLKRAREQARLVVCATNMRTCQQAMVYYLQANQDYFPYSTALNSDGHLVGANPWEFFYKYTQRGTPEPVRDAKKLTLTITDPLTYVCAPSFYLCPNDQIYHLTSQGEVWITPSGEEKHPIYCLSYCVPDDIYWIRDETGDPVTPRKGSYYKAQYDICIMGEYQDDAHTMRAGWMLKDSPANQADHWQLQHLSSGCNAAYLDGHVQYHKRIEPSTSVDPYGFQYGLPPYPASLHGLYQTLVVPPGKTAQEAWEEKYGKTWGHTATVDYVP
jgi:prepilin-type N-terminal cleavage/methylation domain-containing protein/prepilin-type processing-associated H-X9-DG protein